MSTPRNPANKRHSTAFRLPSDLLDRLDAEAAERVVSRNRLVEFLLRDGLTRLAPGSDVEPKENDHDHAQ